MEWNLKAETPVQWNTAEFANVSHSLHILFVAQMLHCLARYFSFPWMGAAILFNLCLLEFPDSLTLIPSLDMKHHMDRTQLHYALHTLPTSYNNFLYFAFWFWCIQYWDLTWGDSLHSLQALRPLLGPLCAPSKELCSQCYSWNLFYSRPNICELQICRAKGSSFCAMPSQSWALTTIVIGEFLHLSTFPANGIIKEAHNM